MKGWWCRSPSVQVTKSLWINSRRQNFYDNYEWCLLRRKKKQKETNKPHPPLTRPHVTLSWMSLPTCSLNSGTALLRGGGGGKTSFFFFWSGSSRWPFRASKSFNWFCRRLGPYDDPFTLPPFWTKFRIKKIRTLDRIEGSNALWGIITPSADFVADWSPTILSHYQNLERSLE